MEMGISRRAVLGLAAFTLTLAGCGEKPNSQAGTSNPSPLSRPHSAAPASFGWLQPSPPPSGWRVASIPDGATMAYPPSWKRIESDPGTATAALLSSQHRFLGYLNLTPRQGNETLTNWPRFRVEHNAEENDRDVRTLTVGTGLRFRTGRGSCVRDAYTTRTGPSYIELACLVSGTRGTAVIVGASPPQFWAQISPLLERAISSTLGPASRSRSEQQQHRS
jgi:hypothetical protein